MELLSPPTTTPNPATWQHPPGSRQDSLYWLHRRMSAIERRFRMAPHRADKGYGQLPWLMTAVRHPWSEAEHNYNKALHKSRGIVEQTIRLVKAGFLCLAWPGGELLYAPWKAVRVIMACCVLHNLSLHHGDTWDISEELDTEVHQHPASSSQSTAEGR
ncbi:putative nuclease HARBI1 isoform X2 [Pyxicephalus adspersus]